MARHTRKIRLFLLFFYLLTSILVLFVFAVRPGMEGYYRASYPDMVYGKAYNPYVQRILLPATVRLITEASPETLIEFVNSNLEDKRMVEILAWDTAYLYEYLVGLSLMLACFLGFAFTLRNLVRSIYNYPALANDLAPIGGLLLLPLFFRYYSYPYDPPTLLLFALATQAILTRRLFLYYVVFSLAILNKETSVLLVGVFFVSHYRDRGNSKLFFHSAAQLLLWVAARGIIAFWFRDAPGNIAEFHLIDHNLRLPIEHPISFAYAIGMAAIFLGIVRSGWSNKPRFLRGAFLVTTIPIFIAIVFLGFVDELRDYLEAFTFLYLLSIPTIMSLIGVKEGDSNKKSGESQMRSVWEG